jgi:hypothetical protein
MQRQQHVAIDGFLSKTQSVGRATHSLFLENSKNDI